jgi:CxxC motif-containing protein
MNFFKVNPDYDIPVKVFCIKCGNECEINVYDDSTSFSRMYRCHRCQLAWKNTNMPVRYLATLQDSESVNND